MQPVLLVIHLLVTLAMIGFILLQRSEGGGLGIGGGSGGMGALAGSHTTANMLTRSSAVLATIFFITNLSLAYISKVNTSAESVIEKVSIESKTRLPVVPMDGDPALMPNTEPKAPTVPIVE